MNGRQRNFVGEHRATPLQQRNAEHTNKTSVGVPGRQGNLPRRDFAFWQQPGFSSGNGATGAAGRGPRRASRGPDPVLVEQLPSPISHIPTLIARGATPRKSKPAVGVQKPLRPRMGVGVSMGVATKSSTPKANCASGNLCSQTSDHRGDNGRAECDDAEEEEPIYCEITKGDTPTKTPPSAKHGPKQQNKKRPQPPPVVQRRNLPTTNRSSTAATLLQQTQTSGAQHHRSACDDDAREKRQARDFSFLRIGEDAFKRPPTANAQGRVQRPRQRRISCDVEGDPSLAQHQAVYQDPFQAAHPVTNAHMTGSRMGRRAVTQVELALPSTRHFQARQQMFHDRVMTSSRVPPINHSGWSGVSRLPSANRAGFSDSEFPHPISSGRERFEQVRAYVHGFGETPRGKLTSQAPFVQNASYSAETERRGTLGALLGTKQPARGNAKKDRENRRGFLCG